jgi:hypothetical protein
MTDALAFASTSAKYAAGNKLTGEVEKFGTPFTHQLNQTQ